MSPCSRDYIFTSGRAGVWRVVSEDSDLEDRPFLLIDCTGWVFTARRCDVRVPPDTQLFQHIAKFY